MANDEIKKEIEEHLNKAVQLQKELESLAEKIRAEIDEVKTLSLRAEEAQPEILEEEKKEAGEILEVEDVAPEVEITEEAVPKPAASEEAPEEEGAESGVDFAKELEKVKKIKEMLGAPEEAEPKKEEVTEEVKVEEKIEEAIPPMEKIEEPAPEADISFEVEEKAEPAEAPPSEKEIEVAIGEEPLPEVEKVPEIDEKEAFEAPALEKEPEISIEEKPLPEEEKAPELEVEKPAEEAPPVEKEPEAPLEEKPIPEEKEVAEVEESDTMQTMFSGRWKKHWQDKPGPGEKPEEKPEEMPAAPPEVKEIPDIHEKETVAAPSPGEKAEEPIMAEPQPEVEMEPKVEVEPQVEVKPEAAVEPGAAAGEVGPPKGRRASDILEVLEKIKKTEPEEGGEVCYYEHQGKILVDSECIITAMHSHLEEGKKLYEKLTQTESPKDQFFVKQEIIKHQEALRGIVEIATKLLDKENSSLPQHTSEVINQKVLKDLLENLSMQNWSNQDDFTFFDEYAIKIKSQFDAQTDPKVDFLKSLLMELGIQ